MHILGSRTAIWRISLRFFSPPEKPTLMGRLSMSASIFSAAAFWRTSLRKSPDDTSVLAAGLALGVERGAQERHVADARDFHGILEGKEEPRRRALLGREGEEVAPAERAVPCVTS
jgi:hypothetical protein